MKKTLVAVVCSATLVLPSFAFAQEQTNTVQIEVTQPQVELSTVFNTDNVTDLQVATLSETEMKETEGAWLPLVYGGLGGLGGLSGYMTERVMYNQPMTWQGALYSTATGAITGGGAVMLGKAAGGGIGATIWNINSQALNFGLSPVIDYYKW